MNKYLDWFNVMTYDFHGSWEAKTGHNTQMYEDKNDTSSDAPPAFIKSKYNCDTAIQAYIKAGIPREKIIMGMALYGHGWQGVTSTEQNGFSQNASNVPPMGTWEPGSYDYDDLKKNYLPTYARFWDNSSKVPFLFNKEKGMWITYDDLQSNTVKNNYILQEKLGGAMFWEFSCDRSAELISNTYTALHGGSTPAPDTTTTATSTTTTAGNTTTTITTTTTSGDVRQWEENHDYHVGDRVIYDQKLYECLEAHTSEATWTPPETPALWKLIEFDLF
jgi:chitinase